ncbi:hypothetical protein NECAME_10192 [Necator americanus]|uniref:Uncharacterized protein n=1 Tax=Necator americanus TaxID=51031 RepID=W2TC10_NECAM|nr:hypothetical protein NECAME_10192 [Necator americanus]ETN78726.1 hypothetical protein NECAME_10192 [Necator americanus]
MFAAGVSDVLFCDFSASTSATPSQMHASPERLTYHQLVQGSKNDWRSEGIGEATTARALTGAIRPLHRAGDPPSSDGGQRLARTPGRRTQRPPRDSSPHSTHTNLLPRSGLPPRRPLAAEAKRGQAKVENTSPDEKAYDESEGNLDKELTS